MKYNDLPSLSESSNELLKNLQSKKPVFFLDYDGTLTPIVEHAEDAVISEEMRQQVKKLSEKVPLAIVSGRDLQDVKKMVNLDELIYAGSHGFDILGPGLKMQHEKAVDCLPMFDEAEEILRGKSEDISGMKIERKLFAIAVHYRQVDENEVGKVKKLVEKITSKYDCFKLAGGKKIFELKPNLDWNKGYAVAWLLEKLDLNTEDYLPIYFGDDLTDEDAFHALKELNGIGVLVGDHDSSTEADYRLETPAEVEEFFRQFNLKLSN
jgi:alpha,alpha-trehalase